MPKMKFAIDVIGTVAVAAAIGFMVAKGGSTHSNTRASAKPLPKVPITLDGAQVRGDRRAPVAVLEFADFECPFCAAFARDVLPELARSYLDTGRAFLAVRQMPLSIHRMAKPLAQAVVCAGAKDRFWHMNQWLFTRPTTPDMPAVVSQAEALGLDKSEFIGCVTDVAPRVVEADLAHAKALAVDATPTFFVGRVRGDGRLQVTERIVGSEKFAAFEKAIDNADRMRGTQ